ncbi:MAG: NADH-quinone oxidoreductase subunit NuoE [archaeon]
MPDINKILSKYSSKDDLIPAMQEMQKELGFLSEESLEQISKQLKVPLSHISGVATFYSMFKLTPPGKFHISICRGTACHVHDSEQLLKFMEKKLSIKAGEMTKDALFSLECVNCIGACAKAPAMMINDTVYGNLDEKKIDKILNSLK